MVETMAFPQLPRDPLRVPVTVLRWTQYALALDDLSPRIHRFTLVDTRKCHLFSSSSGWQPVGSSTSTPMLTFYEVCPRKDKRGVTLISDVLPFGQLWYGEPNVRGAATPENENDRPKRLFQDHGLDLCQTVRGLTNAIYLDRPAKFFAVFF